MAGGETIWYFDRSGKPAFYRIGDSAFQNGKRIYWISGCNWFSNESERLKRVFYESEKWLYRDGGTPEFYRV